MNKQLDLIVFDWDGTLMDSAARIVASLQAASYELGLSGRSDAECRNVIGLGMKEATSMLHPDMGGEQLSMFADRYRHHFLVASPQPEKLFAGALEMLQALTAQQLWLAVATGKSRSGLDRALGQTDCRRYFHTTRCADETCSKPNPQMLCEIMDELGVDPAKTLMIGDSEYDLDMAERAGVASIGVSYGAHESDRLDNFGALATLASVSELQAWLLDNVSMGMSR